MSLNNFASQGKGWGKRGRERERETPVFLRFSSYISFYFFPLWKHHLCTYKHLCVDRTEMLSLHVWLFPLILHIPRIWRVYYLAPPPSPPGPWTWFSSSPSCLHSTFSAHKVADSHPWLKVNTLDDIWIPILNSFIYPLFCGLPNYFFVMICCWQKE